jgi:integrase
MGHALSAWREVAPDSRHDLVCPNRHGGPDLAEGKGLQAAAGVGHPSGRYYVLHEARNTTATLLLELGVDPRVVQAILGHSSITTSRTLDDGAA